MFLKSFIAAVVRQFEMRDSKPRSETSTSPSSRKREEKRSGRFVAIDLRVQPPRFIDSDDDREILQQRISRRGDRDAFVIMLRST
jgi:hypothetical protein